MSNLKIGIISYGKNLVDAENTMIYNTFKENGIDINFLDLNQLKINYDKDGIKMTLQQDLKFEDFDALWVRGVFSHLKLTAGLCWYLKKTGRLVLDNGLLQERQVINKITDGLKLIDAKLPFPQSWYCSNIEDYKPILEKVKYPILIKHRSMSLGDGIYKINTYEEAWQMLEGFALENNKQRKYYIQEMLYLKADYRIFVLGGKVVGAMQRIPKDGEFRANFHKGGSVVPIELTQEIIDFGERGAKAVNCPMSAGVDLVYTQDDKPYILEVNRTPGFNGFMKAHNGKINIPLLYLDYIKSQIEISKKAQ